MARLRYLYTAINFGARQYSKMAWNLKKLYGALFYKIFKRKIENQWKSCFPIFCRNLPFLKPKREKLSQRSLRENQWISVVQSKLDLLCLRVRYFAKVVIIPGASWYGFDRLGRTYNFQWWVLELIIFVTIE